MNVIETTLPDVLVVEPMVFDDARGFFMESFNGERYREVGIPDRFVQDNFSYSVRGVLRGLHFQNPNPQGKLASVLWGEVFDVVVDIRVGSPTFGRWTGATLSAENKCQLYIPPDFAHGFLVTSEAALFFYKCTDYYHPPSEGTILWNDPDVGIQWPTDAPILSDKDRAATPLCAMPEEALPRYRRE